MEFGIFSDEGCVADGFFSREEAEAFMAENMSEEDGCHVVEEICHAFGCEECNAAEEDE